MRLPRRTLVVAAALVPVGTLAGHVAGYLAAGRHPGVDGGHGHLRPGAWLATLAALVALGWLAAARGPVRTRVPLGPLAAGQAVLFVGLESAEHLVWGHGLGRLWAEPALRWGLAAQVVAASLLVAAAAVARATGDRVRALLFRRRPVVTAAAAPVDAASAVRGATLASPASERGPPRALVSA